VQGVVKLPLDFFVVGDVLGLRYKVSIAVRKTHQIIIQ
jgi:hypothetical protein